MSTEESQESNPEAVEDEGKTIGSVEFRPERFAIHRQVEKTLAGKFSTERQHPVFIAKLPSHCVSMNVGIIEAGITGGNHRHYYESMIYVIKGEGYSIVEGVKVEWQGGDVVYVPPWAWHQHFNTDPDREVRYIACTNAPLLQNVGNIARREEETK